MLFSATQTTKVEDLARCALNRAPLYINVHEHLSVATAEGLTQGYVICPAEQRFLLLFTFLKKNVKKKVIVFLSSCNSVKFHAELLNYIDLPVMDLHGKQKQQKRSNTFIEFKNAQHGIMLCTDVAARGLDLPQVDWVIQFDPPDDPKVCSGSDSILLILDRNTFIVLDERLALAVVGMLCCSCYHRNWASCVI